MSSSPTKRTVETVRTKTRLWTELTVPVVHKRVLDRSESVYDALIQKIQRKRKPWEKNKAIRDGGECTSVVTKELAFALPCHSKDKSHDNRSFSLTESGMLRAITRAHESFLTLVTSVQAFSSALYLS